MGQVEVLMRTALSVVLCVLVAGCLAQSVGAVRTPPEANPHVGDLEIGPEGAAGPVFVRDGEVTVRGPIEGDLLVIDGSVRMEEGGSVTGHLAVVRGGYTNDVSAPVGKVTVGTEVPEGFRRMAADVPDKVPEYGELVALFALLAIGALVVSVLAHIASPRRSQLTGKAIASRPWMTAVLGLGVTALAGFIVVLNLLLFRWGPWVPVGAFLLFVMAVGGLAALALGYGSALEQFGAGVLRRFGKPEAGPISNRAAAVGVLFVLKLIPVAGLAVVLFEVGMLLSGLGATIQTGFGTASGWLAGRMRAPAEGA